MPSSSKSQFNLMKIAASNEKFAEERGIDFKMAKEWHEKDMELLGEDPEWFKNLPEKLGKKERKEKKAKRKAKKGDKKSKASTESASLSAEIFGEFFMPHENINGPLYRVTTLPNHYMKWDVEAMEDTIEESQFKQNAKLPAAILAGIYSEGDYRKDLLDRVERTIEATGDYLKMIYEKSFKGELSPASIGVLSGPLAPFTAIGNGQRIAAFYGHNGYLEALTMDGALKANELIGDIQELMAECDVIASGRADELQAYAGYTRPARENLLTIQNALATYIQQSMLPKVE